MAIHFYSWPQSSGARVQWALEELGLPYEYTVLDRTKGEHKKPEFLAINPNAKVPALVDDGTSYFESLAIILYLGERYGVERKLWPASGQDRADALSWTVWAMTELYYSTREHVYHGLDSPISYKPEDRSKAAGEHNRNQAARCLDMLEKRLADRENICGAFTLADVTAGSVVHFAKMFGTGFEAHPRVAAWHERIRKRAAVAKLR
jgi:glutathione S-transferase